MIRDAAADNSAANNHHLRMAGKLHSPTSTR
jgi:hypothetical protein